MQSINKNWIKSIKGFTLVELIVVIVILAILGILAFTQLGGFSGNARDSQRVSDLANISQGLDLTYVKLGSFPTPDNAINITYSGGVLWYQGTVGDTVMNILGANGAKLSRKPTDPLTPTREYTYSKTANSAYTYQLKTDYEGDSVAYLPHLTSPKIGEEFLVISPLIQGLREAVGLRTTYAATGNPTLSYIKGTYNGVVAKTITGSTTYIIATPSIITSQTGTIGSNFEITTLPNKLLLNGQTNSGGIAFTGKLVYSSGALPSTDAERLTFATNLANTYSGTTPESNSNIQSFSSARKAADNTTLTTLGGYAVVNWLGGTKISTINNDGGGGGGGGCTSGAYSTSITYTAGQCFTYTLPSGSVISVDVTGPGYGTVAGTKTLHTPACNTDDIVIWQNGTTNIQVWAACNVGASIAVPYTESANVVAGNTTPDATEKTRIGNFYQWGNNGDITNSSNLTSRITTCASFNDSTYSNTINFIVSNTTDPAYDWCSVTNNNLWGDTTNTTVARKGPCPLGYHVPTGGTYNTGTELGTTYVIGNNMSILGACDQSTGNQPYDRLRCAIMMPLSGYRGLNGSWSSQGTFGAFWSSSNPLANVNTYNISFSVGDGNVSGTPARSGGFPVRCIKN